MKAGEELEWAMEGEAAFCESIHPLRGTRSLASGGCRRQPTMAARSLIILKFKGQGVDDPLRLYVRLFEAFCYLLRKDLTTLIDPAASGVAALPRVSSSKLLAHAKRFYRSGFPFKTRRP